jgi:hypothetical protein
MNIAGLSKLHLGIYALAVALCRRAIEANRNFPAANFNLAVGLAELGRLDEARSAVKAGLALNPTYTISRTRAVYTSGSDDPTFLTSLSPLSRACARGSLSNDRHAPP